MPVIRLATRSSQLALWQARHVARLLRAAHPGLEVVLVRTTSSGDQDHATPLYRLGGIGVFCKEVQEAVLAGKADAGVIPTAFLAGNGQFLVVHVVNTSDAETPVVLEVKNLANPRPAARWRTSGTQDMEALAPLAPVGSGYADTLPGLSLTTYRLELTPAR